MDNYTKVYNEASNILKNVKDNISYYHPEKALPLLKLATEKFLKSIIYFYEIPVNMEFYNIEDLIDLIEDKTTIKLPPFKDLLIELEYSYCEGGCSNQVFFKNLPTYYLQAVEDLKFFVENELGGLS